MTILERKSRLRYVLLSILLSLSFLFESFDLLWIVVVVLPVAILLLDLYRRETRILAEYGIDNQWRRIAIYVYYLLMTSSGILINMRSDFSRLGLMFVPLEFIFGIFFPLVKVNSGEIKIFDIDNYFNIFKVVWLYIMVIIISLFLAHYSPLFLTVLYIVTMLYFLYWKIPILEDESEIVIGWGRLILITAIGTRAILPLPFFIMHDIHTRGFWKRIEE